jgi:hypothetical protein
MLRHLEDELLAIVLGLEGVKNGGELLGIELDIDDGTDNLINLAVTNTGRAGESGEGRSAEVEGANSPTRHRREGRASRSGEGGNAATDERAKKLCISLN